MRAQSFDDRRSERHPWKHRKWEWASLRFEDGDFNTAFFLDTTAREQWFYQAVGASPAMFRRDTKAGSLYWLGHRDSNFASLDGGENYKQTVPTPVPGKLFWSVTVYDTESRSQIQTVQKPTQLGHTPSGIIVLQKLPEFIIQSTPAHPASSQSESAVAPLARLQHSHLVTATHSNRPSPEGTQKLTKKREVQRDF